MYTSIDIETTGLNQRSDLIFSYCVGYPSGKVLVKRSFDKEFLQKYFDNVSIKKICHNFKFEYSFFKHSGIIINKKTIWHDTMIMAKLLHNLKHSYKLEDLWFEYDDDADLTIDKKVKQQATCRGDRYDRVDKDLFYEYQTMDGWRPMLLFNLFYPEIKKDPQLFLEYQNEIEFTKVCIKMEDEGICVDVKETQDLISYLKKEINKIHDEVYKLEGVFINLNSDIKIKELLYTKYKLPIIKLTKTKKPAVDKDVILELLEKYPQYSPLFNLILKIRSYTTGCSILNSYLEFKDCNNIIHPNLQPNEARTGRPSCRKPNLLNVSKEDVRKNPYPVQARKCFCAKPGFILYFGDYSGLQMRLIADACDEKEMIEIINQGGDVHKIPTELFYSGVKNPIVKEDVLDSKIWKTYRGAGKNANFAMPFGSGVLNLSKVLMLPLDVTQIGVERYKQRFPRVSSFSKFMIAQVKEFGYVKTHFGRKLYVLKDKAYMGANYFIQGDEAGLMKRAIVLIDKYFEEKWDKRVRLILDIYDEIIFTLPLELEHKEQEIVNHVTFLMTHIPEIKIRLDTQWKKSKTNWYKAKRFKLK